MLLSRVGLLLFGLPIGSLQLIVPDVLSLLRFEEFGMSMMSGLDGSMLVMPFLLIALLLLVMSLVLGSFGLMQLRERCRVLFVWLVDLLTRGAFAQVGVQRALIEFDWVGPKFAGLVLGALILGILLWLIYIGIIVWLRLLI